MLLFYRVFHQINIALVSMTDFLKLFYLHFYNVLNKHVIKSTLKLKSLRNRVSKRRSEEEVSINYKLLCNFFPQLSGKQRGYFSHSLSDC